MSLLLLMSMSIDMPLADTIVTLTRMSVRVADTTSMVRLIGTRRMRELIGIVIDITITLMVLINRMKCHLVGSIVTKILQASLLITLPLIPMHQLLL